MAILKCKMCGGDIELSADKTFGTCESCGSTMTFPKVDDDQRANRFNRGNQFRRAGEFDKALAVYEQIVQEDENDAEAHWCCALCRFGIEYVEDPNTFEYLPTCHRASFDSFLEDVDYLAALEHSDGITRRQYQKDAQKIAEVQRGILATSQNEEPFDVFICYKESENDGTRTRDSLLAQEIYYQLTEQGRRVFFSRITLEDKAGTEYEPYIFAALNSAKVMIVVTTSAEHVNAVWVKNEWSRFLSLMRKDRSKLLLPCYRDMDPYDLPEALSVLQSYDMSKIGFIQDLIRGVNKVLNAQKPKETLRETVKETVVVQQQTNANAAPLLKRAFMFLEDGDFARADEFCEKVLNLDPENAEAYLGKLMAELHVKTRDALKDQPEPFDDRNNYQKAVRFGDGKLRQKLSGNIAFINERNENARREGIYQNALRLFKTRSYVDAAAEFGKISDYKDAQDKKAESEKLAEEVRKTRIYNDGVKAVNAASKKSAYKMAAATFKKIPGFKDADALAERCLEQAEICRKDAIYQSARYQMTDNTVSGYESAIKTFRTIPGWKDADDQILACQRKIEEIKAKEAAERMERERRIEQRRIKVKKRKRIIAIATPIVVACIALLIVLTTVIIPKQKLKKATALLNAGDYETAYALFEEIGNKDAIVSSKYDRAMALIDSGDYETAYALLEEIGNKDAIASSKYDRAMALIDSGDYKTAYALLEEIGNKDAIASSKYDRATALIDSGDYETAYALLEEIGNKDAIASSKYDRATALIGSGDYDKALPLLLRVQGYREADSRLKECWNHVAARNTIAAGDSHTVGLRSDGTVVSVGYNRYGQCGVSGWKDIAAIAAGWSHTVGLKSDGTVAAVGKNSDGQCRVSEWKDIVAIAAGNYHTVGLRSDGTTAAVGSNGDGQCNVSDWTDIVAIAAGGYHTVGIRLDGTVVAIGKNSNNQCDVSDWKDIVAIALGGRHTVGLRSDGTVVAVGLNNFGQDEVSPWTDIVAISAGEYHTVGLRSDGTVAAVGNNNYGQCDVSDWTEIVAIAAGNRHTIGLKSDGTVVAVGSNTNGQCDVSDWKNIRIPNKQ